jgi:hypothetical protein
MNLFQASRSTASICAKPSSPPEPLISSATARTLSSWTSVATTLAPSRAKSRASSAPWPLAAPRDDRYFSVESAH